MVALIATTPMIMTASASPPVKREIPAAAVSNATGRELTCSLTTSHTDRGSGSGSLLGPYVSSLVRATSPVNPVAGNVCNVDKVVPTSKKFPPAPSSRRRLVRGGVGDKRRLYASFVRQGEEGQCTFGERVASAGACVMAIFACRLARALGLSTITLGAGFVMVPFGANRDLAVKLCRR